MWWMWPSHISTTEGSNDGSLVTAKGLPGTRHVAKSGVRDTRLAVRVLAGTSTAIGGVGGPGDALAHDQSRNPQ